MTTTHLKGRGRVNSNLIKAMGMITSYAIKEMGMLTSHPIKGKGDGHPPSQGEGEAHLLTK